MKVRSNLKSGQDSAENPHSPQEVVRRMVDTMQTDVKDLNFWSLIRVNNQGLSSWILLSQKPPRAQPVQPQLPSYPTGRQG